LHVINASKQGCSNLLVSEKRLRGMHRHLAGDWEEANLALRVLTTTAARGPQHANALLRGLDWDHKALAKLAKPTRCGFQGEWLLPAPQLVHVLLVIAPLWGALELHVRMSKGWCRLVPSTCRGTPSATLRMPIPRNSRPMWHTPASSSPCYMAAKALIGPASSASGGTEGHMQ
jgi:hypothetical protein